MTRAEAIEILLDTPIDITSAREDDIHTLYATAQSMAIEALQNLSKPNNGLQGSDLISRQELMTRLTEFCEWCKDGRLQGVEFVLDCIVPNMPSANRPTKHTLPDGTEIPIDEESYEIGYTHGQMAESLKKSIDYINGAKMGGVVK